MTYSLWKLQLRQSPAANPRSYDNLFPTPLWESAYPDPTQGTPCWAPDSKTPSGFGSETRKCRASFWGSNTFWYRWSVLYPLPKAAGITTPTWRVGTPLVGQSPRRNISIWVQCLLTLLSWTQPPHLHARYERTWSCCLEARMKRRVRILPPAQHGDTHGSTGRCLHIEGMWSLSWKEGEHNLMVRYKAQLVAFGNHQIKGIYHTYMYASVGSVNSLSILWARTASTNLLIRQFDIETAFLNQTIHKDVYVWQVLNFEHPTQPHCVWKLNQSLQRAKQDTCCWQLEFNAKAEKFNLFPFSSNSAVYGLKDKRGALIVPLHVNNFHNVCSNL